MPCGPLHLETVNINNENALGKLSGVGESFTREDKTTLIGCSAPTKVTVFRYELLQLAICCFYFYIFSKSTFLTCATKDKLSIYKKLIQNTLNIWNLLYGTSKYQALMKGKRTRKIKWYLIAMQLFMQSLSQGHKKSNRNLLEQMKRCRTKPAF